MLLLLCCRYTQSAALSHLETWEKEKEEMEALSAMAGLSMYQAAMQENNNLYRYTQDEILSSIN